MICKHIGGKKLKWFEVCVEYENDGNRCFPDYNFPMLITFAIVLLLGLFTSWQLSEDFTSVPSAISQIGPHWAPIGENEDNFGYYDYDGHKIGNVYVFAGEWKSIQSCNTDFEQVWDSKETAQQYVERVCAEHEYKELK